MPRFFPTILGISVFSLLTAGAVSWCEDSQPDAKSRLLDDLKYLASDELEGRGLGTNGLKMAGDFIRQEYERAGLAVDRVKGGAFQNFEVTTGGKLTEPNVVQFIGPDNTTIDLKLGQDFEACSFGGSGSFEGEVVFCGYGIETKDEGYNDFASLDVKGKVIVLIRRTPRQADQHIAHAFMRHADLRSKMNQAQSHGAAAVLIVNDHFSKRKTIESTKENVSNAAVKVVTAAEQFLGADATNTEKLLEHRNQLSATVNQYKSVRSSADTADNDPLMKFGYADFSDKKEAPPAFHVKQALIDKLLASIKTKLETLESDIDSDFKPRSAVIPGWKVSGKLSMERTRSEIRNVIGVIDGEGSLADETVVIGAHYDHLGRGAPGSAAPGSTEIHNGADDNASGTAALLELARRFGKAPRLKQPARRIVFIAFTGEEAGLFGSARYCKEPVYPLDKTVAMLNLDMVGRLKPDNKLIVYGTGTSSRWEAELKFDNKQDYFKLLFKPEGFGPSDHSSFYAKKIPVLHFFTGEHPDYHRPSDDWEKLNIDGMVHIVDLVASVAKSTIETIERPEYVEVKGTASPMRTGSRPYFGSIPEFGNEEPGYSISGTGPGSPAEKGGLKGGDRIIKLGGHGVSNLDDFDAALRNFKAGDEIEVIVVRDKSQIALKVILDPPR